METVEQQINSFMNMDFSGWSEADLENLMEQITMQIQTKNFIKYSNKFDKKAFDKVYREALENPRSHFPCKNGTIVLRKELTRNIIVAIRHLTQELDAPLLFTGREGSGKSLFVRQILYAFWWYLKEFGLINYEFGLDLVHFGIEELQEDRVKYDLDLGLKFRISDLDESKDDLGREKHNDPKTVAFINYLRRCRDECGIFGLLQPWLSEFLPSIVLSRSLMIFEVDYDTDEETGDIVRGEYKVFIMPRGKSGFSYYHGKRISRSEILSTISDYLYNSKLRYSSLPNKILFIRGEFNQVDPLDTQGYIEKKRAKKWERIYKKREEESELKRKAREYVKVLEQRNILLKCLRDNNVENEEVADYMGVSVRTVQRMYKEALNYNK